MFEAAVAFYGSYIGLSRLFGVSRAACAQWKAAGGFPPLRALQIEKISNGRFKALDIVDPKELEIN